LLQLTVAIYDEADEGKEYWGEKKKREKNGER
jgi:hypothetical protein